nr:hypothetical protein [Tanacetum cinerariifolium]
VAKVLKVSLLSLELHVRGCFLIHFSYNNAISNDEIIFAINGSASQLETAQQLVQVRMIMLSYTHPE